MNAAREKPVLDDVASPATASVTDTLLMVETPEKIKFQYQLVGPFRRIVAYGLDLLFSVVGYTILVFVVSMIFALLVSFSQGTLLGSIFSAIAEVGAAIILILSLIHI